MKKLMMTAAAMTIACGAYAQCVINPGQEFGDCAFVYNVKISGKSTVAKYMPVTEEVICEIDQSTDIFYREPASFAWDGYLVSCFCGCDEFNQGSYLMLWDKKAKAYIFNDGVPVTEEAPGWYGTTDFATTYIPANVNYRLPRVNSAAQAVAPVFGSIIQWGIGNPTMSGIATDNMFSFGANAAFINAPYNVISKKYNKVEAFWNISRTMTLPKVVNNIISVPPRGISMYAAGQGTIDPKIGLMKSISGNFAGIIGAPYYEANLACLPANAYDCEMVWWTGYDSAMYGNWSMSYNSSYSKKLVDENYGHSYVYNKGPVYPNKAMRSNNYRYAEF